MSRKIAIIATIVVFAAIGFVIQPAGPVGQLIWPASTDIPAPEGAQLPFLMFYGVLAAIGFGLAVAFLIFGRPLVKSLGLSSTMTTVMQLSIFWVMGNWVIHDSLHINNGHDMWGLIRIEFAFHATLILAGILIVVGLFQVARQRGVVAETPTPAAPKPRARGRNA